MLRSIAVLIGIVTLLGLVTAPPAQASPGANGSIMTVGGGIYGPGRYSGGVYVGHVAAFSPTGDRIAHVDPRDGGTFSTRIALLGPDGVSTPLVRLAAQVENISWSPDGRYLAVGAETRQGKDVIYKIAVDGSSQVVLLTGPSAYSIVHPEYSPVSNVIAFSVSGLDIFTIDDVPGAVPVQRTHDCSYTANLSWSCDKQVIYKRDHAEWSPDGTRMVMDVTKVNFSTGAAKSYVGVLTLGEEIPTVRATIVTANGSDSAFPVWSPDGAKLAYYRDASGTAQDGVVTVGVTSGAPRLVAPDYYAADWQACPTSPCTKWGGVVIGG